MNTTLDNLRDLFPADWSGEELARGQTAFFKALSLAAHRFYGGKIQILPRAPLPGFNWFNAWYTPGVSAVSTAIRDDNDLSFDLSWRGNLVAIVSDSTRVLGDGDVTPPGGLGVMEGKAYLMKTLGAVDAVPVCVDSRGADGRPSADVLVDFVRRLAPSFGAVNLEDISQPNCFRVLDELRETCGIPVWHDDAQGTGCVTLAGLLNALKVAGKKLEDVRIVFNGAGASNTTIARLILARGADPAKTVMCDSRGALRANRPDVGGDPRFYRKWEIARATNPQGVETFEEAMRGADVLISLTRPGPDARVAAAVGTMAEDAIVFACANPVPEIYPAAALAAGAKVVATGRGDFPNQVNNSVGFPGILKGALLVRATKITDAMAIAAAETIAARAEATGLDAEHVMPLMTDREVFALTAEAVGQKAIEEGVARKTFAPGEILSRARADIAQVAEESRLLEERFLASCPEELILSARDRAVHAVRG